MTSMSFDEFEAAMDRHTPDQSVGTTASSRDARAANALSAFSTLDDVPDFALRSLEQLYVLLIARFEAYCGVILYGPLDLSLRDAGFWGRQLFLPSSEMLQVRFAPKNLLDTEDAKLVMLATRVVNAIGQAQVATFVGFRADAIEERSIGRIEYQPRPVGAKGLHIFLAGIFKRHNPRVSSDVIGDIRTTASTVHDPFGYQSLRPSSFSVFASDRKNLALATDHQNASSTAPGYSLLYIAGELQNVHLESLRVRAAEPITAAKWSGNVDFMRKSVLHENGNEAGEQALAAAATIVELLSAECFVAMRSNAFFQGALPDRFAGPHGTALALAMSVRLAINWDRHALPRPSAADLAANDHLRTIVDSGPFAPLPAADDALVWCIDIVLKSANSLVTVELDELRKAKNLPANTQLALGYDNKLFWQRVGQRVITCTFGLGSSSGVSQENGVYGAPWKLHDPLATARDKQAIERGCMLEGLDSPTIQLATISERRTALVRMLLDVERWLRTGAVHDERYSPENGTSTAEEQIHQTKLVIGELITPSVRRRLTEQAAASGYMAPAFDVNGETYETSTPFEDQLAKKMSEHMNLHSMASAINDCKEYLVHGASYHWRYNSGTYIVGKTQTSPCTDCEQPVHVLQGVLLHNSYGACTACHAKRCLQCAAAYAQAVCVTTPQYAGKRCRRCGAEPSWVDVKKSTNVKGEEVLTMHVSQRTARVQHSQHLKSVAPAGKSTKARSRKGDKYGKGEP